MKFEAKFKQASCESSEDCEIPPYLRLPEDGTRLATEFMIARIDHKISKLAELGLRPHQILLEY